jgi:hypothetical protein
VGARNSAFNLTPRKPMIEISRRGGCRWLLNLAPEHRVLSLDKKHRVTLHESGHTLVAIRVPTGELLHVVSYARL